MKSLVRAKSVTLGTALKQLL